MSTIKLNKPSAGDEQPKRSKPVRRGPATLRDRTQPPPKAAPKRAEAEAPVAKQKKHTEPFHNFTYDIVIIDEAQDMNPLYFELATYILKKLNNFFGTRFPGSIC